jgi:hypothetical protein
MTTKVTISLDTPNHQDALVEQVNPADGKVWHGARRLKAGESAEFYVHSSVSLRITEIPSITEPQSN